MSMLQRLEVADRLISRGDTIDARAHGKTLPDAPRQRPLLQAMAAMWRLWRERQATRHALATMDTRTMRDIGISPELVSYELSRLSWRPMLDWHAARYVHGIDVSRSGSARNGSHQSRRG